MHGLAVDVSCEVEWLDEAFRVLFSDFVVSDWPDGFLPISGVIRPFEENTVLRHLSPNAKLVTRPNESIELYQEGERFWTIDDRWGLCDVNLLRAQWRSWILPSNDDPLMCLERAIVWPMAQLLRARGLHLMPSISLARDGHGILIVSPIGIEEEVAALMAAGYQVIGQRWTALREEDGQVALMHVPVEDLSIEFDPRTVGAPQRHAFCDTLILIDAGRRPRPCSRRLSLDEAPQLLRNAWPIAELHPMRRHAHLATMLVQQCQLRQMQLSNRPEDLVEMIDVIHSSGRPSLKITPPLSLRLGRAESLRRRSQVA